MLPIPSTVVMAMSATLHSGVRQALTATCLVTSSSLSYRDTITVHAPHPPSPQPNLLPVKCTVMCLVKVLSTELAVYQGTTKYGN